jgi:hypothetical protein
MTATRTPSLALDPARVADLAAHGIQRIQRDDPETFEHLCALVEEGGGGMFATTLLSDGTVVLALAGVALWRGPRSLVERGQAVRFN